MATKIFASNFPLAPITRRVQKKSGLGTPLMTNPADPSREYYVYTFQRSGGDIKEQRVIVYYDNDQYSHYEAQLLEETPAY